MKSLKFILVAALFALSTSAMAQVKISQMDTDNADSAKLGYVPIVRGGHNYKVRLDSAVAPQPVVILGYDGVEGDSLYLGPLKPEATGYAMYSYNSYADHTRQSSHFSQMGGQIQRTAWHGTGATADDYDYNTNKATENFTPDNYFFGLIHSSDYVTMLALNSGELYYMGADPANTSIQSTMHFLPGLFEFDGMSSDGLYHTKVYSDALGAVNIEADQKIVLDANGNTGLEINHQGPRIINPYVPTGGADTNGAPGQLGADDNYIYFKTSTGWKRAALSSF